MPWIQIDDTPAQSGLPPLTVHVKGWDGVERRTSTETLRLVTWRCRGCRALAVTQGEDPGACLKRGCPYHKPS